MVKKIIILSVILFLFTSSLSAEKVEFLNEDLGISIRAPWGWYITKPNGKDTVYLFLSHKYPIGSTPVGANPGIVMSVREIPKGIKTDFDEAKRIIRDYIMTFYKDVNILEEPKSIGMGVRFESEMTIIRKERTFRIREIDYIFLRRGYVFRLTAFSEASKFEDLKKEFQDSIATLRIR